MNRARIPDIKAALMMPQTVPPAIAPMFELCCKAEVEVGVGVKVEVEVENDDVLEVMMGWET